jgi:broad specificity phosphatase PhoE
VNAVSRVVAVRHGETDWSVAGRHTGLTDVPLNEDGRRQAIETGSRLAGLTFALVLTSPAARAVETCRLAGFGDGATVEPDAHEWDYGEYEGLTSEQIRERRPDWRMWTDGCPGGEDAAAVGRRADRVIARCRSAAGDVAVFAHGHFIRVLGARWIAADPALGELLLLQTAAICVLDWEHGTPVIGRWNDAPGLIAAR